MKEPAATLVLSEDGRGQNNITVDLEYRSFACATPYELMLEFRVEAFPKWAGMSVLDGRRTVHVVSPGPAASTQRHSERFVVNHAWDLENAPEDADFVYELRPMLRASTAPTNGPAR